MKMDLLKPILVFTLEDNEISNSVFSNERGISKAVRDEVHLLQLYHSLRPDMERCNAGPV